MVKALTLEQVQNIVNAFPGCFFNWGRVSLANAFHAGLPDVPEPVEGAVDAMTPRERLKELGWTVSTHRLGKWWSAQVDSPNARHVTFSEESEEAALAAVLAMVERRAEAVTNGVAGAAIHLARHCRKCEGYAQMSSATNDEPPCASCDLGFVISELDIAEIVYPEEYR
jgi:hypothetical protein